MKTCKTCANSELTTYEETWWDDTIGKHECKRRRICLCNSISDSHLADDGLLYQYDEDGIFYVGDNFGCIHYEEKESCEE